MKTGRARRRREVLFSLTLRMIMWEEAMTEHEELREHPSGRSL
jgi:hypothetical protein